MEAGIGDKYTFCDGTPTHICIHFIFLANKCSGLHFPSNDIYLRWKFSGGRRNFWDWAFLPFKVIQGHWYWCQSKALGRLPISP